MKTLATLAIAAGLAAAPASAGYVNVWSTSFDTSEYATLGPFPWSVLSTAYGGAIFDSAGTAPGLGSRFFHNDTAGTTTFTASGLGTHSSLKLSFDLVFVDSWDSNNGFCCTPDNMNVNVNGTTSVYTVAIASGSNDILGPGTLTAYGYYLGNPAWADKIVHYDLIIPHSASSFYLSLNADGAGFQYGDDESWGIDNFALSAMGSVPEPSSWAMLIAGFGLTGAAMRRRKVALSA